MEKFYHSKIKDMNIYEIYVTVIEARKGLKNGKITSKRKRVTIPVLVAETTGLRAHKKIKRVFDGQLGNRKDIAITYTRPDCIISNR
jgi:hypothetical protein